MNSEREPGSVIESRIEAFAQADQKRVLGHVERTCSRCGKDWGSDPKTFLCPKCGFNECEVRVVPPTPLVIQGWDPNGRGGVDVPIMGIDHKLEDSSWLVVDDQDLAALFRLKASLLEVERCLLSADATARRLVNQNSANFKAFSRFQEAMNLMCTPGGFEIDPHQPLKAIGLLMMLPSLVFEIDQAIQRYEEEAAK
jgi:hypothetical protein